jgi:hypothetical protein
VKNDAPSPLLAAVHVLEQELLELARRAEQANRHPLNSEKHLKQTASSLQGIGEMEERLRAAMAQLAHALDNLGSRQQTLLHKAAVRAGKLRARHEVLAELMTSFRAVAASAGEIQQLMEVDGAELGTIVDKMAVLVSNAEAVEAKAVADDFVDVVREARSLRQRLSSTNASIMRKLS